MIISLRGRLEVASMPSGVVGQISFTRLIEELRRSGELKPHETIIHLQLDIRRGMIVYRIENEVS